MDCQICRNVVPIEDYGVVRVRHTSSISSSLEELPYESREELIQILLEGEGRWIDGKAEGQGDSEGLELAILSAHAAGLEEWKEKSWLPLSVWKARLRHYDLIRIIHNKQFTSYMQPIVRAEDQSLYGYEFLLRPIPGGPSFTPGELFQAAQETGFHSFLDRSSRISAIETSAQFLPVGVKRFVNFLPSSIYNPNYCLSHTFEAIRTNRLEPSDFVFEVVETERIENIPHLKNIFLTYKQNGVKVALDDVGAGHATMEVLLQLEPDYVKIDRGLVSFCDQHPEQLDKLKHIVEAARRFGGTVLAEGIERPEEAAACRMAGVELLQGYYFGKPTPGPSL